MIKLKVQLICPTIILILNKYRITDTDKIIY